jgi:CcmD family protein
MRLDRWRPAARLTALLILLWGGTGGSFLDTARASQPPAGQAAQDEFVPIDQLPPEDRLPAAPLLVGAYGFVWVALLGYFWSLWRRLGRVERELADVRRRGQAERRT